MLTIQTAGDRTRQVFFFLVVCLLLSEGACKKDHSSSNQEPSSLSFSYSGDTTGSFSAVGDYPEGPLANGNIFYEWAKSERVVRFIDPINPFSIEDWIIITANFPKSQSTPESNFISFRLPEKGNGTYHLVNGWEVAEVNLSAQTFVFTGGQ